MLTIAAMTRRLTRPRDTAPIAPLDRLTSVDPTTTPGFRFETLTTLSKHPQLFGCLCAIAIRSGATVDPLGVHLDALPLEELALVILEHYPSIGKLAIEDYQKQVAWAKTLRKLAPSAARSDRVGLRLSGVATPKKVLQRIRRWTGKQRHRKIVLNPAPKPRREEWRIDKKTGERVLHKIRHTQPWVRNEPNPLALIEKVPYCEGLYRLTDHALRLVKFSDVIAKRERRGEVWRRRAFAKQKRRADHIGATVARLIREKYPLGVDLDLFYECAVAAGSKIARTGARYLAKDLSKIGLLYSVDYGWYQVNVTHPSYIPNPVSGIYKAAAEATKQSANYVSPVIMEKAT